MRWIDIVLLRLRGLLQHNRAETELDEELRFHLERQIEQNIARGLPPTEARYAAMREFGGVTQIQEQCRESRRVHRMENLIRDLRHGARSLLQSPLLLLTAALSLGLGIGANTTLYSLMREILLTPPTASEPQKLISFWMGHGSHVSYQQWRDLDDTAALDGVAGYQLERQVNLRLGEDTTALFPFFVTANYFDVLGIQAELGRTFTAQEARAELDPQLAVLGYGFWRRRLNGDPAVLGRVLNLNGYPYTIVGVLPKDTRAVFGYGVAPDVYLPLNRKLMPDLNESDAATVTLFGRMKDGMSVEQARAALATVGQNLESTYPPESKGWGKVQRIYALDDPSRLSELPLLPVFALLGVVVGLVLLIACANIAGLLLARGTTRFRETAVRSALGASRARLLQQFLIESLLLALSGGAVGLLLNFWLIKLLDGAPLPLPIPVEFHLHPDLQLLLVGFALAAVTAVVCGLMPALNATKPKLSLVLKQQEPRFGRSRLAWRKALVAGQVAVSLVLVVTAFLFLRNLGRVAGANPGFEVHHLVWSEVSLIPDRYPREVHQAWVDAVVAELRALPGVRAASYARGVPLSLRGLAVRGAPFEIDGAEVQVLSSMNWVGSGYFAAMGTPVLAGREFTGNDLSSADQVIIVNETFVNRYLSGRNPIGRTLAQKSPDGSRVQEIVGVVADSKVHSLGEEPRPAIYEPYQARGAATNFLVRVDGSAQSAIAMVDRVVQNHDPLAAVETRTMRQGLAFALLPSQLGMAILGTLGLLGLLLAMVGLYGMMAYAVSRRTSEIGIRVALGATQTQILQMALRDSLTVVGAGMLVGLAIALPATRLLVEFLVPGLSPNDPISLIGTVLLLGSAAVAASYLPARRASRVSPTVALRYE
jgi:putative ABC transport system permease protein